MSSERSEGRAGEKLKEAVPLMARHNMIVEEAAPREALLAASIERKALGHQEALVTV
jgi:hypothetical protein